MRALAFLLSILAATLSLTAAAQEPLATSQILKGSSSYNMRPEDWNSYCLWAGNLYSLGASFCARQSTLLTCTEWPGKRPIWVAKDNDKACDKNPSLTPL